MSSESPVVELYSSDGYELSAQNNVALPLGTRGLISAGYDGTTVRFILIDGSARQVMVGAGTAGTPAGGVVSIQGVAGGTAVPVSGTVTANAGTGSFTVVQATAANLNATVVQGTAANLRTQTASEAATAATTPTVAGLAGGAVTTAAPTYTTGQMDPLSLTTTGLLRVDGSGVTQPVSGTVTANAGTGNFNVIGTGTAGTAATGVVTIQGIAGGVAVPISGTVTAANASVSTTNTTPPGSATYIGGSVTTAAPTYTTATMNALSLTTAGALRIDGSAVTQPVSGTVTANAGTGTFTVAGTVTSNQGTANTLANAWSTKITDATNGPAAVKAASTAAIATDPALVVAISPNNSILVTTTNDPVYGTNNQSITITLTSLASAAARASTAVSNTTSLYTDVLLFFKIKTGATGTSATGYINVYGYGSVDGGTTYPEGITGTDAGVTLTSPPNLVIIAQINTVANATTYTFGPISFCRMYGIDKLPAQWGVVVVNQSGHALDTTAGGTVTYQGVN